ncbi:MAG: hypothetical protein KKG93_03750 [Bacteroidetes bacterium]|nr:hypothetical protein [Bacteroidota bacterium]
MNDAKTLKFNLIKVSTEQFAILGDPPCKEEEINLAFGIKFGVNPQSRGLLVLTQFRFEDSKKSAFLLIECGCHFEIIEPDWNSILDIEHKKLTLPKGFASHLVMLAVGTTRGVLHAKTENTSLNVFNIPLINVANQVPSDIVIQIADKPILMDVI